MMLNTLPPVSLDDKYTLKEGRAWMTGTQALVRLPMMQRMRDPVERRPVQQPVNPIEMK